MKKKLIILIATMVFTGLLLTGCVEERVAVYVAPQDGYNSSATASVTVEEKESSEAFIDRFVGLDGTFEHSTFNKNNKKYHFFYTTTQNLSYNALAKLYNQEEAVDKCLNLYNGETTSFITALYYKTVNISNTRIYMHDDKYSKSKYKLTQEDKDDFKLVMAENSYYYDFYMPGTILSCKGITSFSGNHAILKYDPFNPPETIEIIASSSNMQNPINPYLSEGYVEPGIYDGLDEPPDTDDYTDPVIDYPEPEPDPIPVPFKATLSTQKPGTYQSNLTFQFENASMVNILTGDVSNCYVENLGNSIMGITIDKDGIYIFEVTNRDGSTKNRYKYTIDKTKPTVRNIKNNRIYKTIKTINYSDKTSGIKKATLNGKRVHNGTKVRKNGSYTLRVYDKAGNIRTIYFKIKK